MTDNDEARAGTVRLPAWHYEQFDADFASDVPAEGFGGWRKDEVELSLGHTAVVVMHAWDCGTREQYPGWHRIAEYIPRAEEIARTVFPPLLAAVRASPLRLLHVVGGGDYYRQCPGYRHAVEIAPAEPEPEKVGPDPVYRQLERLLVRRRQGAHNIEDRDRGFRHLDFAPQARPRDDEGVAENAGQLAALCREGGVNHLVYTGFAINWCLLMSPGGMLDMSRRGVMCSAIRQAVTAVENKQTARRELCKEIGLWRVAMTFGFVFDLDDFLTALAGAA